MQIPVMPTTQSIDYKWSRLTEDFYFQSDVLDRWCMIPAGFCFDWESVPIIKGTSKVAGLIHDYLSRKDSEPVVTKAVAAKVYLEVMRFRRVPAWRRWIKYSIVKVWPWYFHRKSVNWQKPERALA